MQVDYFSLISPYAYLGHAAFMDLARRHEAAVTYRPVHPLDVFAAAGGVPLGKRAPSRQRYRLLEQGLLTPLGQVTPQRSACGTRKSEEVYVDTRPSDDAVPRALRRGPSGCFPAVTRRLRAA